MRILRHGSVEYINKRKSKLTEKFKCSACGCKFKADYGEYETGPQWRDEPTMLWINCPYCGERIHKKGWKNYRDYPSKLRSINHDNC